MTATTTWVWISSCHELGPIAHAMGPNCVYERDLAARRKHASLGLGHGRP